MSSYYSTNNCSSPCANANPCGNTNWSNNNNTSHCKPSSCFRPLQQLYKTVYSPACATTGSNLNFECICQPAERYKTTNMSYGSFLYDDQSSTPKDQVLKYDRAIFARCYDNNRRAEHQSKGGDRSKDAFNMNNPYDPRESLLWKSTTGDACCPVDCCTSTKPCPTAQNNTPCCSPCPPPAVPMCSTPNSSYSTPYF